MSEKMRITELTLKSFEGQISQEEFAELDAYLSSSKANACYFTNCIATCMVIMDFSEVADSTCCFDSKSFDHDLWNELAAYEKTAPEAKIPQETQKQEPVRKAGRERVKHEVSRGAVITVITSIAAFLVMILYVSLSGQAPYEMATVSDSIDAKWSSRLNIKSGVRLSSDKRPIQLTQGIVKLMTDDGVMVVLEAPTEFRFVSYSEIVLNYGKLFAHVSEQGRGFSVTTSNSRLVDLGTEFGVIAQIDGNTEVYMYQGKANLFAGQEDKIISEQLTAGFANKVDRLNSVIKQIPMQEDIVVRNIDSKTKFIWRGENLDLADIVGGGNGFGTGTLDGGIETHTGRRFESPDPELVQSKIPGILFGDGTYNEVSSLPFIDGVFVPDSRQEPVQITSTGQTFDGFVDGREVYWGNIFNGAWHASDQAIKHFLKLNGQAYGTPGNPAISIHANQGVTFDLQAIRQAIPGGRILRFTSLFGVSETVAQAPTFDPQSGLNSGKVNCWVLIDGKEKFSRNSVSYLHGAIEIEVDILDEDRFLTLVVTESNDRRAFDWALFARPFLQIEMDMN
jgi:hypothetical protein